MLRDPKPDLAQHPARLAAWPAAPGAVHRGSQHLVSADLVVMTGPPGAGTLKRLPASWQARSRVRLAAMGILTLTNPVTPAARARAPGQGGSNAGHCGYQAPAQGPGVLR